MRRAAVLLVAAFAAASCSSDGPSVEATTTSLPAGVNCEAANIVALGNRTLGDILEQGLVPIGTAFSVEETQAAIDQNVPPMSEAILELMPALNRAVADLRASLPTNLRDDVDTYLGFLQDYARSAASITKPAGFEATLRLEVSEASEHFDEALLALDTELVRSCGVTLRIDRPDETVEGAVGG
jgi:hypothetical protein